MTCNSNDEINGYLGIRAERANVDFAGGDSAVRVDLQWALVIAIVTWW